MSNDIIKVIDNLTGMRHLSAAEKIDIITAEADLELNFAEDYKKYVSTYGLITANGIEITGVCKSPRLNVVNATLQEREMNPDIPGDMYVIESTGFEGMIILQDADGFIYSVVPNRKPEKIFDSLADYLLDLQKN